jgi:hypothetical protein
MIQIPQKVRGVGYPLDEELALAWGLTHELNRTAGSRTVPASGFGQKQGRLYGFRTTFLSTESASVVDRVGARSLRTIILRQVFKIIYYITMH